MNVMKKAHQDTRSLMAQEPGKYSYRVVFAAMLVNAHWFNKQEAKKMNPAKAWAEKAIEDAQKRISELEAIEHTDGFIVVVGDSIRLPLDEVQGKWCRVEVASLFWYVEDARRFASRVRNGSNEVGQVVKKIDQIKWEIEQQNILIEDLKKAL